MPAEAVRRFDPTRLRHPGGISGSALSPDGKRLATAGRHFVVVWDLATGTPVRRFDTGPHNHYCTQKMAFSPDGRRLAACPGSEHVFVWDLDSGAELKRLDAPPGRFFESVAFAVGGREVVVGDHKAVAVYDARTWAVSRTLPGGAKLLSAGGTLVGLAARNQVVLTDLATGKRVELDTFTEMDGLANGLALAPDGKTLAVRTRGGDVELWAIPDGRRTATLTGAAADRYHTVAFSGDGKTVFLGTSSGVYRWDAGTRRALPKWDRRFDSASGRLTGLHVLPDGDTLLACAEDGLVYRYGLKSGKESPPPEGYAGRVVAAASADGRVLAVGDRAGRVDLWDLTAGGPPRTACTAGPAVSLVALSPDGKTVAIGLDHGEVELRDCGTGALRYTLQTPARAQFMYVRTLYFSPDGRTVCARNWSGGLRAWDAGSGEQRWSRAQDAVSAFGPDGKVLVSAVGGPVLVFADPATGAEGRRARLDTQARGFETVTALAFAPDGRRLVVATADRLLRFCDPTTAAERARVEVTEPPADRFLALREPGHAEALAFSPDGKLLAAAGSDGTVRVFEAATRREVRRFAGHDKRVTMVGWGPGGRTVLSAGEDGAVFQWDPRPAAAAAPDPDRWAELAADDPAAAYRAVWALAADPAAAVRVLRAKLTPARAPDPERLARLIERLGADRYPDREAASKELLALGPLGEPALRAVARSDRPAETRERAQKVLDAIVGDIGRDPPRDDLRVMRAVQALELAGTPDARALLTEWASGAAGARLTEEAAGALRRLPKN
jgi:WD40 repeat protein